MKGKVYISDSFRNYTFPCYFEKYCIKQQKYRVENKNEKHCKPGYVSDDHLSRIAVAGNLNRPT